MKQILLLLIAVALCFTACKRDLSVAKIHGQISGLSNDTIYIYGMDEFSDFITPVPLNEGQFTTSIPVDTLTQVMIFLKDQNEFPVFLEKGAVINVTADVNDPEAYLVQGGASNDELHEFKKKITEEGLLSDSLMRNEIENYIYTHQKSYINIFLLDKYFVRTSSPDFPRIKRMIEMMDGALQDRLYIEELLALIENTDKAETGKSVPFFTMNNAEGKRVSRADFRDQYLLITFWASWSDSCRAVNDSLKMIAKRYKVKPKKKETVNTKYTASESGANARKKDNELALLGISLDSDKKAWEEAIARDTLKWEQVSDFKGWQSNIVTQFAIHEIPYHVLIDPYGKIIARGIMNGELNLKLEELLKKTK